MNALAMSSPTLAQRYIDAWNDHDAASLIDCFAADGSYSDPAAGENITPTALGAHAASLWAAFPDLQFEIVSVDAGGAQGVATQWIMRGTHLGPFHGHAPTGQPIALPGADFIRMGAEGIRSVRSYFDSGAMLRQLGLLTSTQPESIGPFSFGVSTRVQSGRKRQPGAFTVTRLRARNGADGAALQEAGCEIAQDLLGRPGFLSAMTTAVGDEMMTVAAWDSVEAVQQLRDTRHLQVMAEHFGPALSSGGATSVWAPAAQSPLWVRCTACGTMADSGAHGGSCGCGAKLPEPSPFW
jgi:steroid delta-isomerase-like uncharacterized protein